MNRTIALPGTVWLASDVHLGPDVPATRAAFHEFLARAAHQADALILCGDLFDAWTGDDLALAAPEPWLAESLERLRQAASAIPVWMGRGNRDFLMGPRLAAHLGARLLPDVARLDTDAGPLLLSHGDEYCTADLAYQRFRRLVRNRCVQALFLSLGPGLRARIARCARRRSMASTRLKASDITDVAPQAIDAAFRESGLDIMVHGHTHRPAVHTLQVDGRPRTRYVLPDWDHDHGEPPRGGWLAIEGGVITLHRAA